MFASDMALPEFAFVEASDHDTESFRAGRNLIIHPSTLTLMEIFESADILIMDIPQDTPKIDFNYITKSGAKVRYKIVLQATVQLSSEDTLKDAAVWFCKYLRWYEINIPN